MTAIYPFTGHFICNLMQNARICASRSVKGLIITKWTCKSTLCNTTTPNHHKTMHSMNPFVFVKQKAKVNNNVMHPQFFCLCKATGYFPRNIERQLSNIQSYTSKITQADGLQLNTMNTILH